MGWRGGGASLPVKGNGGHFQQFYQYIDNALKVLYCTVVFPLFTDTGIIIILILMMMIIGEIWRELDDFFSLLQLPRNAAAPGLCTVIYTLEDMQHNWYWK